MGEYLITAMMDQIYYYMYLSASSVVFPVDQNDVSSSRQLPEPSPRPPHLPFRRISLPSVPHAAENRHSIVSFTSFDSTPEEAQPSLPALMKGVAKQQKTNAHPHLHQRPSSRLRSKSNNRRNDAVNLALSERRRKVVNEILDTERAYVNGLDLVYTVRVTLFALRSCSLTCTLELSYASHLIPRYSTATPWPSRAHFHFLQFHRYLESSSVILHVSYDPFI